jgi:cysteine desulfuration protein SufE
MPEERLDEIIDLFREAPRELRLQLLLEYANALPELPAHLVADHDAMEQVRECQTPFFVAAERDGDGYRLYFDAPPEAPTTRGYAGVLASGLSGAGADEILGTPSDFFLRMGLQELISPLRLRGMGAILARVKRIVVEQENAAGVG